MFSKLGRWFIIKTRCEALAVIYALALGAVSRGQDYLEQYPGWPGYLLFAACTGAVFMAGAKILEVTRPDSKWRRRKEDLVRDGAPLLGQSGGTAPPAARFDGGERRFPARRAPERAC